MKSNTTSDDQQRKTTGRGNFFAVDLERIHRISGGSMNDLAAYLVLARFTAADNRTTRASTHAVETHTGISRARSKAAIDRLVEGGHVSRELMPRKKGDASAPAPKHYLCPLKERKPLTDNQRAAYEAVKGGEQPTGRVRQSAEGAVSKGWLASRYRAGRATYSLPPDAPVAWLPNEFVTGAAGEVPPLELIRQSGDVLALRLAIDLYGAQNLADDGGVSRRIAEVIYDRELVADVGEWSVWGFKYKTGNTSEGPVTKPHWEKSTTANQLVFWDRYNLLTSLGVFEEVPHLFDSEDLDAEPIFPMHSTGDGRSENRIAEAVTGAAHRLLFPDVLDGAFAKGFRTLVPVKRHRINVQLRSVLRARYRAKTARTSAWWAHLQKQEAALVKTYDAVRTINGGTLGVACA